MTAGRSVHKAARIALIIACLIPSLGAAQTIKEELSQTLEGIKSSEAKNKELGEKRRTVETWIRLSQYEVDKRREGYVESAVKAVKHLVFTTPD